MKLFLVISVCSVLSCVQGGRSRREDCSNSEEFSKRSVNGQRCGSACGENKHGATWWDGNFKQKCEHGEKSVVACKNDGLGVTDLAVSTSVTVNGIVLKCVENELGKVEIQMRNSKCPDDWEATKTGCFKSLEGKMRSEKAVESCKKLNPRATLPWFNNEEEYNEFEHAARHMEGNRKLVWLAMKKGKLAWGIKKSNNSTCGAKVFHWRSSRLEARSATRRNMKCAIHNTQLSDDWTRFRCGDADDINVICQIPLQEPDCKLPLSKTSTEPATTTPPPETCPSDWVKTSSACYKAPFGTKKGMTYNQAKSECKKQDPRAVLPSFKDQQEYEEFKNATKVTGLTSDWFWLEMTDIREENVWEVTSPDGTVCSAKVLDWYNGAPYQQKYPERNYDRDCGVYSYGYHQMLDFPCGYTVVRVMCQIRIKGDVCKTD